MVSPTRIIALRINDLCPVAGRSRDASHPQTARETASATPLPYPIADRSPPVSRYGRNALHHQYVVARIHIEWTSKACCRGSLRRFGGPLNWHCRRPLGGHSSSGWSKPSGARCRRATSIVIRNDLVHWPTGASDGAGYKGG